MKKIWAFAAFFQVGFVFAQRSDYPITAVPFTQVKLTDHFWLPRIQTNARVTIPASFARCESTGRVRNFEMAALRKGKFCSLFPFDDTDIYKTIEGASYSLSLFPDPALEHYIDTLIEKIGKAQEPDGYLYTARTIDPEHPHAWAGTVRWQKEREMSHELYNAGHLYEAAAAHFAATGKRSFLNIALKNADLVCKVFGPAPDQLKVAPGHEVVEMGLVKLYRITGKELYLSTAKFFIEQRGHFPGYDSTSRDEFKNGMYWQDNIPVTEQQEAEGHAVRAGYLYSAMADVAALTGDQDLLKAIDRIWANEIGKKMYVQGGVGAIGDGERFGGDYELPNATAYNETCAAIASVFFNERMFLLHGESKYIDVMEKTLYNGFISGVGMDGKSFFYTNAMQIKNGFSHPDMEAERSGWFPCSCCPTNVVRLMPSIPGYVYAQREQDVYINLFVSGHSTLQVAHTAVEILQENNYPWDGALRFRINPAATLSFTLRVRIPGWAQNQAMPSDLYAFAGATGQKAVIRINGKTFDYPVKNGYAVIARAWKKGDLLELDLPMEVRRVVANKMVKDDLGKTALQRGPLIYCAEWPDNNGQVSNIMLPEDLIFKTEFRDTLLNGLMVVRSEVPAVVVGDFGNDVSTRIQPFMAIPYYAWAHRGKGEMMVWFPEKVRSVDLLTKK
jgi:uncharacterized protein